MDRHDELMEEAERLAKDKKPNELARLAFVYSYVANHELADLCKDVKHNRWLIVAFCLPIVLAAVINLVK